MADNEKGYNEDGLWIAALPHCRVHNEVEPCSECGAYIAAGC